MHLLINSCPLQACGSSNNEDEERKVISSADSEGTPLQPQQDSAPKGKTSTYVAVPTCFVSFVRRLAFQSIIVLCSRYFLCPL